MEIKKIYHNNNLNLMSKCIMKDHNNKKNLEIINLRLYKSLNIKYLSHNPLFNNRNFKSPQFKGNIHLQSLNHFLSIDNNTLQKYLSLNNNNFTSPISINNTRYFIVIIIII